MRVGNNPEKERNATNKLWKHRVIIVFYLPDTQDGYFAQLGDVLDKCLSSVMRTINPETTCITLIDNGSGQNAKNIAAKYRNAVDKYVEHTENKGKVYAVLNEVRSTYEEFVTISDADILFYDGWEKAVFDVYANHPKAGVVSPHPCPFTTFYFNKSVFGLNSLKGNVSYGKYVSDDAIDLYLKGTNLPKLIERKGADFDWRQKQFILRMPQPTVIGAYHVVATYRTAQFRNVYTFPEVKFRNSYEENFIDCLTDDAGLHRLSTVENYIYHMGNTLDDVVSGHRNEGADLLDAEIFRRIRPTVIEAKPIRFCKWLVGKIFIKLKWNR